MSATKFLALRGKLTDISVTVGEKVKLPEKFKGTILERWSIYWKSLVSDYTDVARDTIKTVRTHPIRSSVLTTFGYFTYLCGKYNPDQLDLLEQVRQHNGDMILVPESCQRPESVEHLKLIERSINEGTLRTLNLGVLTLLWRHDFNEELCTYRAICKYLKPDIFTFHERIIDVGFWNKWWLLDKKMIDYDIVDENL